MSDGFTRLVTEEELRLRRRMAVALAELECAAKILRDALLAESSVSETGGPENVRSRS